MKTLTAAAQHAVESITTDNNGLTVTLKTGYAFSIRQPKTDKQSIRFAHGITFKNPNHFYSSWQHAIEKCDCDVCTDPDLNLDDDDNGAFRHACKDTRCVNVEHLVPGAIHITVV